MPSRNSTTIGTMSGESPHVRQWRTRSSSGHPRQHLTPTPVAPASQERPMEPHPSRSKLGTGRLDWAGASLLLLLVFFVVRRFGIYTGFAGFLATLRLAKGITPGLLMHFLHAAVPTGWPGSPDMHISLPTSWLAHSRARGFTLCKARPASIGMQRRLVVRTAAPSRPPAQAFLITLLTTRPTTI